MGNIKMNSPIPRSIDHTDIIQLLNLDIIRQSEKHPCIKWSKLKKIYKSLEINHGGLELKIEDKPVIALTTFLGWNPYITTR